MNVAGLFAGIGGLELGLAATGARTCLLCDNAPAARAVLDVRFPDAPKHDDVATLRALPVETDVLTAGFPCQDLSQAGLTRGINGTRSSLVAHVFRLLDARPTPLVVLENVSFMLRLDGGSAMATLVAAFSERGYRWAYRVVNSLGFLPQRRERVYLVASRGDVDPRDVLFADEATAPERTTRLDTHAHGFYWTEGVRGLGWAPDAVPTLKTGSTVGIPSPPAVLLPSGSVVKPDIRDAERLQGFPEDWTAPAASLGRAGLRWGLVGNAVTVPVAEWLGRRLAGPGSHDPAREATPRANGGWPLAACGDARGMRMVKIGAFPEWRERLPLAEFLRHTGEPLSARATRGFLARTDTSTLRFAPGFRERVRAHLATLERAPMAAE